MNRGVHGRRGHLDDVEEAARGDVEYVGPDPEVGRHR